MTMATKVYAESECGQPWRQYIIGGIVCLGAWSAGYIGGWTSPIELKLLDPSQSPLPEPVTGDQLSWIGSLVILGTVVLVPEYDRPIGGLASTFIGRKGVFMCVALCYFAGWLLLAGATNIEMLCTARFLFGIGIGINIGMTSMYCGEIASDDRRGALGSFVSMAMALGIFMSYALIPFVTYSVSAIFGVCTVAAFAIGIYFIPESPAYYIVKGDRESAADCLMIIRGKSRAGVDQELDKISAKYDPTSAEKSKLRVSDIWATRGDVRALYIVGIMLCAQHLSGASIFTLYLERILRAANMDLNPSFGAIITGAIQVVASMITPLLMDRQGRRKLLMISTVSMSAALILMGTYFHLEDNGYSIVASIGFMPVLCMVVSNLSYGIGMGPVPFTLLGEMFPINTRAVATPLLCCISNIVAFLVARYFISVVEALGMHSVFWMFGGICISVFIFTLFLIPETKNKSFQEIQDVLNGTIKSIWRT